MNLFSKLFRKEQTDSEGTKKKSTLLPKICCLFCALGLWLLVSGESDIQDEKTYNDIPVVIENADILERSGLSIISGDDYVINITVRGNRAKLASVDSSAIKAKVDVSELSEAKVYSLAVVVTPPSSSGFTVVSQSLDTIDVNVDVLTDRKFDVNVNPLIQLSDEYSYEKTVHPKEVTVSGPQKLLEGLSVSVSPNLGVVTNDVTFNDRIVLLDKYGKEIVSPYITVSDQYAEGTIKLVPKEESNEETEKEVNVVCKYKYGYYKEGESSYTVSPSKVTVRGLKKDVEKIDEICVYVIDETVITSSTVFHVNVESPNGTNLVGDKTVAVSIIVSEEIPSLEIILNNLNYEKLSDTLFAEMDGAYILKLHGDAETLDEIKKMADEGEYPFVASIDMSLIKEAGLYDLPVNVKLNSEFKNVWSETGSIGVRVSSAVD